MRPPFLQNPWAHYTQRQQRDLYAGHAIFGYRRWSLWRALVTAIRRK
jgi:hypothetical protein